MDFWDATLQPVSSFAQPRRAEELLKNCDAKYPICAHRGGANSTSHHVSLFYEGFNKFTSDCDAVEIEKKDAMFVMEVCESMAAFYYGKSGEDSRRNAFMVSFKEYLRDSRPITVNFPDSTLESQANKGKCDALFWFGSHLLAILEAKSEVGQGGCDSFLEAVGYYPKLIRLNDDFERCCAPAFILELVGPHLIISGVIYGNNEICVDRLTDPLWMVFQPGDRQRMEKMAQVFMSLKVAIWELCDYYQSLSKMCQPRFPVYQSICSKPLTYVRSIKFHLFSGKYEGKSVIIKFPSTYCIEAHQLLADNDLAPQIIHYNNMKLKCTERHMVVMEEVQGCNIIKYLKQNPTSISTIQEQCSHALTLLHAEGWCHGDFRSNNILVTGDCKVMVIDFDWAGKENHDKYPSFMNHINIKWPNGASDGLKLQKSHDTWFLEKIFCS